MIFLLLHTTSLPPLFHWIKIRESEQCLRGFCCCFYEFVSGLLMIGGLNVEGFHAPNDRTRVDPVICRAVQGAPSHRAFFTTVVLGLCGCCCCGRSCLWRCWRFRLAGLVIIVLVIVFVTFVAVAVAVLLRRRRRQRQRLLIFRLLPTMIDQAGEQRRVTSCCRSSC